MPIQDPIAIQQEIEPAAKQIVIITHTRPDGDAIGASLGLATFLRHKSHTVKIITPSAHPAFLNWLPGMESVCCYNPNKPTEALEVISQAELIFCVDFGCLQRAEQLGDAIKKASARKIIIDHHQEIEDFADTVFWNPQATSSAELVYELIIALGGDQYIDTELAECLYTGILTDTLCFTTPNTTPRSHVIAAELLKKDIDIAKINTFIYGSHSLSRLKLLGFVLSKRLTVMKAHKTAYIVIKAADAKYFNLQTGDTEGIVNYALSLKGIVLAALIKEKDGKISLSLRSTGDIPVNTWAKEYFNGGGHKNAAGGVSHLSLEETIRNFEDLVKAKHSILSQ